MGFLPSTVQALMSARCTCESSVVLLHDGDVSRLTQELGCRVSKILTKMPSEIPSVFKWFFQRLVQNYILLGFVVCIHISYTYIYIVFICFFFKFHASMESIKMVNMFVDLGFLFSAVEQCYQLQGLWLFSL